MPLQAGEVSPRASPYVPAGQGVQAEARAPEKVPGAHSVHSAALPGEAVPAAQGVAILPTQECPGGQEE